MPASLNSCLKGSKILLVAERPPVDTCSRVPVGVISRWEFIVGAEPELLRSTVTRQTASCPRKRALNDVSSV